MRLAGRRALPDDEIEELVERIDAERSGRVLVEALAGMAGIDREVLELVDIAGLTPKEAASALGIAPGVVPRWLCWSGPNHDAGRTVRCG